MEKNRRGRPEAGRRAGGCAAKGKEKQKLENVWRGFNAVNVPVALELKPCLPDVTVRMFCKLKLLCRIPIRPVNLAKIALNKWTAVYLYSPPPPLYFIDRGELLEMYFTSTRQHVVSARERRFRVIRVGSTLIKEQTGSFL